MNLKIPSFAATVLISACLNQPAQSEEIDKLCADPRPQLCTMNYLPVCGVLEDNSKKTYSNACSACSDEQVVGYSEGECDTTRGARE